jgi:hypothetical protein
MLTIGLACVRSTVSGVIVNETTVGLAEVAAVALGTARPADKRAVTPAKILNASFLHFIGFAPSFSLVLVPDPNMARLIRDK